MWNLLVQTFTWWNSQTMGTRFATWRFGKRVGEDEFGNVYYEGGMFFLTKSATHFVGIIVLKVS